MTDPKLVAWFQAEVARILSVNPDEVTPDRDLLELGMDSLAALQLTGALSEKVGYELDPTIAYEYSTMGQILDHLGKSQGQVR